MKRSENSFIHSLIAFLVAAIACLWGGAISVGIMFAAIFITELAYFFYFKKNGESVKFVLAQCFIIIAASLVFAIQGLIMNKWLLVISAIVLFAFCGYCAVKGISLLKKHSV